MKKIIIIILILVAIVIGFVIYNSTTKEYQALRVTASIPSGQVERLLFVHADTIGSEEVDAFLRTGIWDEEELFLTGGIRRAIYAFDIGPVHGVSGARLRLGDDSYTSADTTIRSKEVDAFLRTGSLDENELLRFNVVTQFNYNRAGFDVEDAVTGFEVNINNPSEGVYWMLVDVQGDLLLSRLEDVDFDPTGQRMFESGWENITGDTYYEGGMKLELIQFVPYLDN